MDFEGQMAVDVVLFILAAAFSLVSIGYIAMLWSLRRNFFIVMRSPRLACALGLLSTLHYLASMYVFTICSADKAARRAAMATLISFPAIISAEMALIMTAVRLLVMYYPSERARWGRFTREVPLTYGLACAYASMEIALWSAVWSQDLISVAAVVETLQPLSAAVIAVAAAVGLSGRLRKVDDAGSMSRDIRGSGAFMLGVLCVLAAVTIAPMPSLASKYFNIMFLSVLHPAIVWISIIRPVKAVVRHIPGRRRSTVETLLVSPHRKTPSCSVAVTADFESVGTLRKRSSCDANRLSSIMSFLPLREAFGEYCRKSLCSESFQFLQDVFEFQSDLVDAAAVGEGKNGFKGFGGFLAIVNDYIKAGSHSEVNIESRTKSEIMKYSKFKDYSLLDLDERKEIFSAATGEIAKMLVDNLLNKFLVSAQYKAVVDFEAVHPR